MSVRLARTLAGCAALLMACGDTRTESPPAPPAAEDMNLVIDMNVALDQGSSGPDDAGTSADAGEVPYVVSSDLPSTERLGMRRGYRVARGVIHAHSVHSHDACDGKPELEDGTPNEPCLDDFRFAICETRQDYIFMTDHEELAARKDYDTLLMVRGDDEVVLEDGVATANRLACENGARPLLLPGGEFGTMPVGMKRHIQGSVAEREEAYAEVTAERVASLREAGAVVLQAHAESKDRETLRALGLDGFEIYQLHANVDPDIRRDFLGLDPTGWLGDARPFINGDGAPDLVFLSFVTPNATAIAHFDALVSEGQTLVGTAGTDCHQNALPLKMSDGERMDSYRRMMRWFSNHLLVPEVTQEALREALREGRAYVAFEAFGTPSGFDFVAEAKGETYEMGQRTRLEDAPSLRLVRPDILDFGAVPTRLEILEVRADGASVVASGEETLTFEPTRAGAYRARVMIKPVHLANSLDPRSKAMAEREYTWIWANPIYVD